MDNALLRKLEQLATLSDEDRRVLVDMVSRTTEIGADRDIVKEGDQPSHCHVLLNGVACRYKLLSEGRRQIIGFQVPGDFCDLTGFVLGRMDHSVATVTSATMAVIPHSSLEEVAERHPRLARALWRETLADASISREWVANVGSRTAYERIAHLLTELALRQGAGGTPKRDFEWPFTQAEIGDATGLSTVHVNRMLQQLRTEGVIELNQRKVTVPDWSRLRRAAGFRPDYLFIANAETSNSTGH